MTQEVTDATAQEMIKDSKISVLVFKAPWCGPCKTYSPIIDEFSKNNTDILVGKIDVDENPRVAATYGIRGIPTTIFFKDGQLITKISGNHTMASLNTIVDNLRG
jgi:thioredoxin 1